MIVAPLILTIILSTASKATEVTTLAGSAAGFKDGNWGGEAQFARPFGIAFHLGMLYIADSENNKIRSVSASDGKVDSFAGCGAKGFLNAELSSSHFNSPFGLAWRQDVLYVADTHNHRIRQINQGLNVVSTFAGSSSQGFQEGPANVAKFNFPHGLSWYEDILYVADSDNHRIREVRLDGMVGTFAGTTQGDMEGSLQFAQLHYPVAVKWQKQAAFILDAWNHKIRHIVDRSMMTFAGSGRAGFRDGPAKVAKFNFPRGFAWGENVLFVADSNNHRIRYVTSDGTVHTLAGNGKAGSVDGLLSLAQFNGPRGIVWKNDFLYVTDTMNHRIRRVSIPKHLAEFAPQAPTEQPKNQDQPVPPSQQPVHAPAHPAQPPARGAAESVKIVTLDETTILSRTAVTTPKDEGIASMMSEHSNLFLTVGVVLVVYLFCFISYGGN